MVSATDSGRLGETAVLVTAADRSRCAPGAVGAAQVSTSGIASEFLMPSAMSYLKTISGTLVSGLQLLVGLLTKALLFARCLPHNVSLGGTY